MYDFSFNCLNNPHDHTMDDDDDDEDGGVCPTDYGAATLSIIMFPEFNCSSIDDGVLLLLGRWTPGECEGEGKGILDHRILYWKRRVAGDN